MYDIPDKVPQIWINVSDKDGFINSNYGWCIFSEENKNQFDNVVKTLKADKLSRQAVMIYTRPNMHNDSIKDGRKDFMCTNNVTCLIRDNKLFYHVYMRSNDAIFGYKNDKYWHDYVYDKLYNELKITYPELLQTNIIWSVTSLHIYDRHFHLIPELSEHDLMLDNRKSKYGNYSDGSDIVNELVKLINSDDSDVKFTTYMLGLKFSRIVLGDTYYFDNPMDICGYITRFLESKPDDWFDNYEQTNYKIDLNKYTSNKDLLELDIIETFNMQICNCIINPKNKNNWLSLFANANDFYYITKQH